MTSLLTVVFSTALSFQFFSQAVEWQSPNRFDLKIANVHLPVGFDDDDVTQLVVEVEFNNTCEDLGPVVVFPHDDFPNVLLLHAEGYRRQANCQPAKNRHRKVIDIGVLEADIYEVRNFKNIDQKFGTLRVRQKGTSKIDSEIYAPVDSMIVTNDIDGYRRTITLAGTFSNTCMYFDFERFKIARTGNRLIEILPVMGVLENENCVEKQTPFLEQINIPIREGALAIPSGRYMFHVRTMNGRSFNKIDTITMPDL